MIKTPNAGSTAREGILGRRKRLLPEPAIFVTIWRKDENGHFEQARIPLSEARKIAGATGRCWSPKRPSAGPAFPRLSGAI